MGVLRPRSPRGGKKHALKSRRVRWLGPPSPSAGGAVLTALASRKGDGGVRYRATKRCQTAGSYESDADVQYHAMRRCQAAGSHESGCGVQYRATKWCQAAGSYESDADVQYRTTKWC